MRKFVALALALLMMLALVPTAFAAAGDVQVLSSDYRYYTGTKITDVTTGTVNGGNVYVSEKFSEFKDWQVPGNVLTGNALSWGKWIEVTSTIFVKGSTANDVYIDGVRYTLKPYNLVKEGVTTPGGTFTITYYIAAVEGGTMQTRLLAVQTSTGVVIDRVSIAVIYQDMYALSNATTVTTEGKNQANTYATIEDTDDDNVYDEIVVDIVYANLIPEYKSTTTTNANFLQPDYYPVRVKVALKDKDGNPYPAFTRVDVESVSDPSIAYFYIGVVPNYASVLYLDENSTFGFEKRFLPGNYYSTYYNEDVLAVYRSYARANGATGQQAIATPYVIDNIGGFNEKDIINALNLRILGYYANNAVIVVSGEQDAQYGINAQGGYTAVMDTLKSDHDATALVTALKALKTKAEAAIAAADPSIALNPLTTIEYALLEDALGTPANDGSTLLADEADWRALFAALSKILGDNDAAIKGGSLAQGQKAFFDNAVADAMYYFDQVNAYTAAVDAIRAYKPSGATHIGDIANVAFAEDDSFVLRLTKANGEVTRHSFTVEYRSVSRVEAKKLTVLEGTSVTIVKGETKSVTVNAYQDQIPVTGLPIKFVSNDTNIATVTSPNTQAVNTNTTAITGINVGTTFVRAYLDTTNDKAEAFIMVNVVDPTPVTPVTPEVPVTTDYVCKVRKLWIRSGAGTSNEKVGYYSRNDVAKVYEVVDGWAKVDYNGSIAYSSTGNGKYLAPR